jgi:hypothetical protein
MLEEIIYQLHSYHKAANLFSTNFSNGLSEKVGMFTDVFSVTERPPTPETLLQYWKNLASE